MKILTKKNKKVSENSKLIRGDSIFFSLKYKILIITVLVISVYIVSQYFFYNKYIFNRISEEEQIYSDKIMSSILNAIRYNTKGISTLNKDWAEWDAMYNAIDNWTNDFVQEAMPDSVFEDLSINFLAVIKNDGTIIYSKSYLPEIKNEVVDFKFNENLRSILISKEKKFSKGIIFNKKWPIFFSSYPILHSNITGPEKGRLIMGRIMDNKFIKGIGAIINENVEYLTKPLSCDCLKKGNCSILTKKDNTINLIFPILDFRGKDIIHVNVTIKRNLFELISKSTKLFTVLSLVIFLALILINTYAVEVFALKRIRKMSEQIDDVNSDKVPVSRSSLIGYDEINILQNSFNKMIDRIEIEEENKRKLEKSMIAMEKMATAGKITYNILHEINNPIRVIKNYLFAVETNGLNTEYLNNIENEINHLSNITNQMLDFSKDEKLQIHKIDLYKIIGETANAVKIAHPGDDYVIQITKKCKSADIKGNAGKIKQVFFNLLKNAIEACEYKGKVEVSIDETEEKIVINVNDDGPGISGNQIEKLFEPFYTKDKKNGIGLGLSISYNIIKNHGGDIFIDPNVDSGASFIVVLPKFISGEQNE